MSKIYKINNDKSLIVTDDYIAISSKKFSDFDDMKKKSDMISLKSDFQIIPKRNFYGLSYNKENQVIKILFASDKNLNDSMKIYPSNYDDLYEIGEIIGKNFLLVKTEKTENKIKSLSINALYVFIATLFSIYFVHISITLKNGAEYTFSGRKRALSELFMRFIDLIGPIGTSIIGLLIIGYFTYKLVKRYKNPSTDVVFKRQIIK
jgi:hypothetical protein